MQKARRHTIKMLRPLVGVRFQELFHSAIRGAFHLLLRPLVGVRFQELFHSAIRGAFHLSLTVLVRYRSLASI